MYTPPPKRPRTTAFPSFLPLLFAAAPAPAADPFYPEVTGGPDAIARPATRHLFQDEVLHSVTPDRFDAADPADERGDDPGECRGCYHGGDFRGLQARLDYIQGLGATAPWARARVFELRTNPGGR